MFISSVLLSKVDSDVIIFEYVIHQQVLWNSC